MNTKEALAILAGEELATGQQFYDARRVVCEAFAALPERLWTVPKVEWEPYSTFDGQRCWKLKNVEPLVQAWMYEGRPHWRLMDGTHRMSGDCDSIEQAKAAAEAAYVAHITRGMVEVQRDG